MAKHWSAQDMGDVLEREASRLSAKILPAREFTMTVSKEDLVARAGQGDDGLTTNSALQAALDVLGVEPDMLELHTQNLAGVPGGRGDVHAFRSRHAQDNVFVIDTYREAGDHLELVTLGFGCDEAIFPTVRQMLRAFFDGASVQVGYEESSYSVRLHSLLDERRYPRWVADSGYRQRLHVRVDG